MAASLTLITGDEPLLVSRAIDDAVETARGSDPNVSKVLIDAADDTAVDDFATAVQPSLFQEASIVIVANIDKSDDALQRALLEAIVHSSDEVHLICVHPGGVGGKALLTKIRELQPTEINCAQIRRGRAVTEFMAREFARHKRKVTPDAMEALYEAIGHDIAMLAGAISQLSADVTSDPIDVDDVRHYFIGTAEVTGFAISDSLWSRQPTEALAALRRADASGERSDVATVSALAMGVRSLIRLAGAPTGASDPDLARVVGAPPWKIKTLRGQLSKWRPGQLAAAVLRLANADAAVKGGLRRGESLSPEQKQLAVEKLVAEISAREEA